MANLTLLVASTVVSLALAEVVARVAGTSMTWASYQAAPELLDATAVTNESIGYRRIPDTDRDGPRGSVVSTDAQGFRNPRRDAPGAEVDIVYLGDSVTEGFGVPVGDRYTALVDSILAGDSVSTRSVNLAVAGHATVDSYAVFERFGIPRDPAVVFLQLGFNDVARNREAWDEFAAGDWSRPRSGSAAEPRPDCGLAASVARRPDGTGGRCSVSGWLQGHSALYLSVAERYNVRSLRRGGSNPILASVTGVTDEDWAATDRVVRALADLCRALGVRLFVFYSPMDVEVQTASAVAAHALETRLRRTVESIGAGPESTDQVVMVPMVSALREAGPGGMFLDDVHLTRAGHRVVADVLAEAVGRPVR